MSEDNQHDFKFDITSEDPAVLTELLAKVSAYNPEADLERIRKAYYFAAHCHQHQKRASGEPYMTHPIAVAFIIADLGMDVDSICVGLLHDVVEDTGCTTEEVKTEFGPIVVKLVEGITKLSSTANRDVSESEYVVKRQEQARAAENLRKMLMAMASDIRVMVIKLADRLHNMKTLDALEPQKQIRISRETMQVYAPLAARLGIWQIKWKLEDLAFKYLYPEEYANISERVSKTRNEREAGIKEAIDELRIRLAEEGIPADVQGRPKHLWSIYQKTLTQNIPFEEIYDLLALRIIVETVSQCYHALGIVHEIWQPIPSLFFDYVSKPKSNGYSSLHTKVMGPSSEPLEVQIRTWDMHRTAELGIAAHWQYKEGGRLDENYASQMGKIRQQIFDWSSDAKSTSDFLQTVATDFFADQVLVFTPKGDVIDLAAGSTPVDLAYRIHTDLGNHTIGAKVNGRIVPLHYQFQNGDIVEIKSRQNASPSADWLKFIKTSHARAKVRAYMRRVHRTENAVHGREAIEKEIKWLGLEVKEYLGEERLSKVAEELHKENVEDLLASVGEGLITVRAIVNRLRGIDHPQQPDAHDPMSQVRQTKTALSVSADGLESMMLSRGRCCSPIPGDEVVGYVSRGKGIVIHRRMCANAQNYFVTEPERVMPLDWTIAAQSSQFFDVPIHVTTTNRQGLLAEITSTVAESKANISSLKAQTYPNQTALIEITIEVNELSQLTNLLNKLTSMQDILHANRVFNEGKQK